MPNNTLLIKEFLKEGYKFLKEDYKFRKEFLKASR